MPNSIKHFDLLVLGCGSGGSACADRAHGYGKNVCVVERGVTYKDGIRQGAGYGGTCVNVGCVPKKLMYQVAHVRETVHGSASVAEGYGLAVGSVPVDWAAIKQRRDAHVMAINAGFRDWPGVTLRTGLARFVGPKRVEVALESGGHCTLTADHILVAVGGYPYSCELPGGHLTINSDGFFELETLPKRAAVIGAGYVAVEMGGILNALGTDTELFCRGNTVLRHGYDAFIVDILTEEMKKHGPRVFPNAQPARFDKAADGTISMTLTDGTTHSGYDVVLWAIGRAPATADLNLAAAGVETNSMSQIVVDEFENTSAPGVYALGDVTQTGWELTPVAIAAGRRLADRLFGGCPGSKIFYEQIPTVVFSHPPIGMVGLPQHVAEQRYGKDNVSVKESKFASMIYAFNPDPQQKVYTGLKLVLVGPEERVVGLHIIGPGADEMLQGFAVAVRMGATRADFEATVAIHPTIGEELITFGGWGKDKNGLPQLAPPPKPVSIAAPVQAVQKAAGTESNVVFHRAHWFLLGITFGSLVVYSIMRGRKSSL